MVKMTLRSNESIQLAVRRFRKLVERSGLKREMRRRAYYVSITQRCSLDANLTPLSRPGNREASSPKCYAREYRTTGEKE